MTSRLTVVGIGASAGGIQAFEAFFRSMPANSGMAFVILLHLPADRKSMLREILARCTPMNVVDAQDGTLIAPDSVFIPPPHTLVSHRWASSGVFTPFRRGTHVSADRHVL